MEQQQVAELKPTVLYFGGFKSTQKDMDAWQASATHEAGESYLFKAYQYPAINSAQADDAVKAFGGPRIAGLAREISEDLTRKYVVVGHSSGCAIANAVAEQALKLEGGVARNFCLIALDGFPPRAQLFDRMPISCWSSENGQTSPETGRR